MKTAFFGSFLLISTGAIAMDQQPQQAPARPRTNEEIMRHFNGASFMRDFLTDGKKLEEEGTVAPVQNDDQ